MKFKDYIFAIRAAQGKTTLDKIIYYCGFDKKLNESEVKAIIEMCSARILEMKRNRKAEVARLNARDIKRIQA